MSTVLQYVHQGGLKEHLTTFADPRSGLLVRPDDTTCTTRPGVSLAELLDQCTTPDASGRVGRSVPRLVRGCAGAGVAPGALCDGAADGHGAPGRPLHRDQAGRYFLFQR